MEVLPRNMEQVETVEMTYKQGVPGSLEKKFPGNLDLRSHADAAITRPYPRDQRLTFAIQLTPVEEQSFVFPEDRMPVARTYSLP